MSEPAYWLDLFTPRTWQEFLDAGATVSGFREGRYGYAKKVKPGDLFLCYLVGLSRFVGLLEVTSELYRDESPIWGEDVFPLRFKTRLLIKLEPEHAVPIKDLLSRFSFADRLRNEHSWEGRVQGSPTKWESSDGRLIIEALREAQANPVIRPFDPRLLKKKASQGKLARRPASAEPHTATGGEALATVKHSDATVDELPADSLGTPSEVRAHSDVQYTLLRLGHEMGFDLWLDPGDRGEIVEGERLGELPGVIETFSVPLASELSDRVRRIDVLWLREDAVVAAFEVEHTTAVYSGLLRMADLLALQPNLNILLFIVAPEKRRDKVRDEITRPTFRKLARPLSKSCRYISFEALKKQYRAVTDLGLASALRPTEFLDSISESFEGN